MLNTEGQLPDGTSVGQSRARHFDAFVPNLFCARFANPPPHPLSPIKITYSRPFSPFLPPLPLSPASSHIAKKSSCSKSSRSSSETWGGGGFDRHTPGGKETDHKGTENINLVTNI